MIRYGLRPLTIFAVESRIAGFGWFTYNSSTPNISYENHIFPQKNMIYDPKLRLWLICHKYGKYKCHFRIQCKILHRKE